MNILPRRLCVVAAHPDDDAIGCGGYMTRAAAASAEILVVYLSDGRASHPNSRNYPPDVVAQLRAGEALTALRILGVERAPSFFGLPDGELSSLPLELRRKTVMQLAAVFGAFEPDVVAAPWRRDPHPDHVASALLTADALAECRCEPTAFGYEVWLRVRGKDEEYPIAGEAHLTTFALSPAEMALKKAAILAHRSQTTDLIDDDPSGFRITEALLDQWASSEERFYRYSCG